MIGRIVEISDDRRHLSKHRGFLVVESGATEIARVPLDDILAVVANGHGITYTNNVLVALAERAVPFVLCGSDHKPVGMLLPVTANYEQTSRIRAQIGCSLPRRKRLWQQIVRAKVAAQASALKSLGLNDTPLRALVRVIKSGDVTNVEAQAARRYWSTLFGTEFRRDREADGINSLLNYGYAVLRSACARAVLAAGLHPSIGLHHSNAQNPFCLADDLLEPFRPLVDLTAKALSERGAPELDTKAKRELVMTLYRDIGTSDGTTPVFLAIQRLAVSLVQALKGEVRALDLPRDLRCAAENDQPS